MISGGPIGPTRITEGVSVKLLVSINRVCYFAGLFSVVV